MSSKSASFTVVTDTERAKTQNVVALWEDRDRSSERNGRHRGTLRPRRNKPMHRVTTRSERSGTTTVRDGLPCSRSPRHLLTQRSGQKRSCPCVWHCGGKGPVGREYFNKFPTVDIKNVVAQLNIDMIGRSLDPNTLSCVIVPETVQSEPDEGERDLRDRFRKMSRQWARSERNQ